MSRNHHRERPRGNHERITIAEFARRIDRTPHTVFVWLKKRRMPPGSVLVDFNGRRLIDWTVYEASIRTVI